MESPALLISHSNLRREVPNQEAPQQGLPNKVFSTRSSQQEASNLIPNPLREVKCKCKYSQ